MVKQFCDYLVIPVCLLIAIWAATPLPESFQDQGVYDGRFYVAMTEHGPSTSRYAREAPWCWRVFTPYLASLLPWSTVENYRAMAFLSVWAALVLIYSILLQSSLGRFVALLGMCFYAGTFFAVKFSFYCPTYIDFQSQLFVLIVIWLMLKKKLVWIPALLALGALQKESILFTIPVVFCFLGREKGYSKQTKLYLLALLIPALITLGLVRLLITPENNYVPEAALRMAFMSRVTNLQFWPRFLIDIFHGLGIFPLILLYRWKTVKTFLLEHYHWFAMILIGLIIIFAGPDKSRLLLFMLIPVLVAGMSEVKTVLKEWNWKIVLWLSSTFLIHIYIGHHLTPVGPPEDVIFNRMFADGLPAKAMYELYLCYGVLFLFWFGLTLVVRPWDKREEE